MRRWSSLQEVSPELRISPLMLLPVVPHSDGMVRTIQRAAAKVVPQLPVGARWEEVPGVPGAPPVRVVVYDRTDRTRPSGVLVWVHGGGRVLGGAAFDHEICSELAERAGILVVSVDYRLAPDHPFPAALDDIIATLAWLQDRADELGVDPARVAVGGASAGGGLAAEAAQRAHDERIPLAFQLLVYPMLDDRTLPGRVERKPWWVWTPAHNRYAWTAYLGHPAGEAEDRPYAVAARRGDLTGLAPAWIGVGQVDLFLREASVYAHRLETAGVPVELHVEPGMPHGADQGSPEVPSMVVFRDRMARALADAVGRRGRPGGENAPGSPHEGSVAG